MIDLVFFSEIPFECTSYLVFTSGRFLSFIGIFPSCLIIPHCLMSIVGHAILNDHMFSLRKKDALFHYLTFDLSPFFLIAVS